MRVVIDGIVYVPADRVLLDTKDVRVFGMDIDTIHQLRQEFIKKFGAEPTSPAVVHTYYERLPK